jgi:RNA polymerase sigma-70 factor (ECF subfamily)
MIACGTTTLLDHIRRDGGADAWTELVRRYWRVVFGYARRQGLNAQDAEDFTQEILTELVRVMPGFEVDPSKGTFRSFLFTMVRRRLVDRKRASTSRTASSERLDWGGVESPDAPWEEEWRRSLLRLAMDEAARGVEPRTFQAFQLVVLDGWAPKRAAEFLDMSVDSVYQAKARVLRHAREVVERVQREEA